MSERDVRQNGRVTLKVGRGEVLRRAYTIEQNSLEGRGCRKPTRTRVKSRTGEGGGSEGDWIVDAHSTLDSMLRRHDIVFDCDIQWLHLTPGTRVISRHRSRERLDVERHASQPPAFGLAHFRQYNSPDEEFRALSAETLSFQIKHL